MTATTIPNYWDFHFRNNHKGWERIICLPRTRLLIPPVKISVEPEGIHSLDAPTSIETQPESCLRHPRGNSGDIGITNRGSSESRGELARAMPSRDRGRRSQRRQRRKWFSRKYYASVMNIKEFYEDNIGKSFTGILSNALNKDFGRNH